jgi:hypothetical protein
MHWLGIRIPKPIVLQSLAHRHALLRVDLQATQDEVDALLGATRGLLPEKGRKLPTLEELPIQILLCRVCAQKQGLCGKQVECAPPKAPSVNLC